MKDRNGNTALHNACKKNYTAIVRMLLAEDSINVNIPNQNGNTALAIAVYENNIEIIQELLKCNNININSLNVQLETPLIAACRMNNYRVAKILLDQQAIINKRYDLNGETAIFHAVRNNNKKLVILLLENEASISFKNKSGKSPLTIAKEYKFKSIVSLLFSHIKNQQALKNKSSTLSLNENLVRSDDKKAFWNGTSHNRNGSLNISHNRNGSLNLPNGNGFISHNRNGSLNLSNGGSYVSHNRNGSFNLSNGNGYINHHKRNGSLGLSNPATTTAVTPSSGLVNELKNNSNKSSFKLGHTRNNSSVTFNRNVVSIPPNPFVNGKHTRHESYSNEGTLNKPGSGSSSVRGGHQHTRHKSYNSEISIRRNNSYSEKFVKGSEDQDPTTENSTEEMGISRPKKIIGSELKHGRSFSNSSDYSSKYRSSSSGISNLGKISYTVESMNAYEEPEGSEEESDTEITTNFLIQKAKERAERTQSEDYISRSNSYPLKHSRSQMSIGRSDSGKKDEYIKPLKTACYNQNTEDIKKFYENMVEE